MYVVAKSLVSLLGPFSSNTLVMLLVVRLFVITAKEQLHKNCVSKVSSLEKAIKEHSRDRESKLASLDKKIKSVKQQMASASKELKVTQ